jgi:hypothetical protein
MAEPLPRTAPAAVHEAPADHTATPEWDTSVFHDLCGTCGWPVSKAPAASEWTHDVTNPSHWTDKRAANV